MTWLDQNHFALLFELFRVCFGQFVSPGILYKQIFYEIVPRMH